MRVGALYSRHLKFDGQVFLPSPTSLHAIPLLLMGGTSPPSESDSSGNAPKGSGSDGNQAEEQYGAASSVKISLSQAILAPLDAIFKSQVHAARSFLNFLQQLGYPHREDDRSAPTPTEGSGPGDSGSTGGSGSAQGTKSAKPNRSETSYTIDFLNEVTLEGGKREVQKISIPALALVPVAPLAVEKARYTFDLEIVEVRRHRQLRRSEAEAKGLSEEKRQKSPWNLVDEPLSLRGSFTPKEDGGGESGTDRRSRIHVEIDVGRIPKPAALDKLLTSLGQMSGIDSDPPEFRKPDTAAGGSASGEEDDASEEDEASEGETGEDESSENASKENAHGEDASAEDDSDEDASDDSADRS